MGKKLSEFRKYLESNNDAETTRFVNENPEVLTEKTVTGLSLLELSAEAGNANLVKFAIEQGLNVDPVDDKSHSALTCACDYGHVEVVRTLLESGADPNKGRAILTALRGPTEQSLEILELMIQHGANVNNVYVMFGNMENRRSVLDFAIDDRQKDLLQKHGAKPASELGDVEPIK